MREINLRGLPTGLFAVTLSLFPVSANSQISTPQSNSTTSQPMVVNDACMEFRSCNEVVFIDGNGQPTKCELSPGSPLNAVNGSCHGMHFQNCQPIGALPAGYAGRAMCVRQPVVNCQPAGQGLALSSNTSGNLCVPHMVGD